MEIKEIIVEALRSLVIPELEAIKTRITVIETRLDGIDKRFEDMNKRFEDMNRRFDDMNKRFEELRFDMNKRFDDQYNFNMKRFDSIEMQINNILAEMRELRCLSNKKVDVDQFRILENRYIELLTEVTRRKKAA
ncbi:MAG: hypothetical protein HZA20_04460 [Nitrospirae bacterium]|nr:hypothetical protein [Nitrospirota bacterium]